MPVTGGKSGRESEEVVYWTVCVGCWTVAEQKLNVVQTLVAGDELGGSGTGGNGDRCVLSLLCNVYALGIRKEQ